MRRLIPVLWLLGCLAPAPAWAALEQRVSATGGITVTWRGDPARGCAEQGVCDLAGSVVLDAAADQGTSTSYGAGRDELMSIDVDLAPPVVRVVRGPASDPVGACVDALGDATLSLQPRPRGRTVELEPTLGHGAPALSAGRCAGPTGADLAGALPRFTASRSVLRRRTVRLRLRGRRSVGAGPFTVEVDAALAVVVRQREVPSGAVGSEVEERIRTRRRALLAVTFAVERTEGALTTSFAGLPGRGYELLDACGVRGATSLRLDPAADARVEVFATGPPSLARGRRPGRALAALAAGRMTLEDHGGADGDLRGRLEGEARREGSSATCRDGQDVGLPAFTVERGRHGARLVLGGESRGGLSGLWRTRCPGPPGPDRGALASGALRLGGLAAERLTVTLAPAVADPWPYAVTTTGGMTVTLRRVGARVSVARMPEW